MENAILIRQGELILIGNVTDTIDIQTIILSIVTVHLHQHKWANELKYIWQKKPIDI